MSKKLIWGSLIAIIVLAAAIYLLRDKIKPLLGKATPAGDGTPNGVIELSTGGLHNPTYDTAALRTHFTLWNLNPDMQLKKGVTGREVTQLQAMLNAVETTQTIIKDGIFGTDTETKLMRVLGKNATTLMEIGTLYEWTF